MEKGSKHLVSLAFEKESLRVPIQSLLPVKQITTAVLGSAKYAQIRASISEIGIIEPPVVKRDKKDKNIFHILDGHLRINILRTRGDVYVVCIIAKEDEAFTYNKYVNRLSIVQEHKMILKAIEKGVSEERLARALNIDVKSIKRKRRLLNGICPEVVELMKDKDVSIHTITELRKLKPIRQIEVVELMVLMNNFTGNYAKALVAATPETQLMTGKKTIRGLNQEQIRLMESEMAALERDFKKAEQAYGDDHLDLVLAIGYVNKLLANVRIVRYLAHNHSEILAEFQKIAEQQEAA